MVMISGRYQGNKHCEMTHEPSGSKIETDAPVDNNGLGQAFSPTDLLAAALGSCMMTVMAIYAEKNGIQLNSGRYQVIKKMQSAPRKISELEVEIHLPGHLEITQRQELEKIALACPVKISLHPDILIPITFLYDSF